MNIHDETAIDPVGYGLQISFDQTEASFAMTATLPEKEGGWKAGDVVTVGKRIDREWCIRWAQRLLECANRLRVGEASDQEAGR